VRLEVTISPKGDVENIQLLGGNPILAESAIFAVKQWVNSVSHSRTTIEVDFRFDARP
jgi:outer membrane biosynthesis protein TonB